MCTSNQNIVMRHSSFSIVKHTFRASSFLSYELSVIASDRRERGNLMFSFYPLPRLKKHFLMEFILNEANEFNVNYI